MMKIGRSGGPIISCFMRACINPELLYLVRVQAACQFVVLRATQALTVAHVATTFI